MQRRRPDLFTTIHTEGGLLPSDLLARISENDQTLHGLSPGTYHLDKGERLSEAINRSWNRLAGAWAGFNALLADAPAGDPATSITRERWLLVLFSELGYGRLQVAKAVEIDGKTYPVSHDWNEAPVHLVGARVFLDKRSPGVAGASRSSPHGLVQELLNRSSERLWGLVSNGLRLRILRDNVSLTRQAFVEFDLEAMMAGEVYSDFVILWLLAHQSRVEGRPDECWLERWSVEAQAQGTRALDQLRSGVEKAISALGQGFLSHPSNRRLLSSLRSGELDIQDYYRQLLRLVYRLLFLFVAEERDLLLHPDANGVSKANYLSYYSAVHLRRLAERKRGSKHADLYRSLSVVMRALGCEEGAPALGLPALGGFLWSETSVAAFAGCDISNRDLLDAVRALAFTHEGHVRRSVDYRNMGAEELGSVYESLLELHPQLNLEAGQFTLATAAGNERKTTGSYYTPTSLITELLNSALDPLLDEAVSSKDPEASQAALLALRICDPACGSGHFLIAAAHRVAKRLAGVRTGEDEPAPEATRTALRDVIGRCIYGVDINEMAVELCKVSLWMEALEPGKPLSFLDHRIACGNSLLGTTPALIAGGIPDEAFKPIEGDDKTFAAALRKRNQNERDQMLKNMPQLGIYEQDLSDFSRQLAEAAAAVDLGGDDTLTALQAKHERFVALKASTAYTQTRMLADAWCAAFVQPKSADSPAEITQATLRILEDDFTQVPDSSRAAIAHLGGQYHWLHWHAEFPGIFLLPGRGEDPANSKSGWSGGFDLLLGNPPWGQIQYDPRVAFSITHPDIVSAPTMAARDRMIAKLEKEDPDAFISHLVHLREVEGLQQFIHASRRYPLTSVGRLNTAPLFAETARTVVAPRGRVGLILPTGIATDSFNQHFFSELVESRSLVSLFGFENEGMIFPGIHHATKFCLLTLAGVDRPAADAEFVFFARSTAELRDENRRFTLSSEDFALLNPNTRTCPVFRSKRDAELTKLIHTRVPVLVDKRPPQKDPWRFKGLLMFMMNTASHLFRTRDQLEPEGWVLYGNSFCRGPEKYLPLYEAKMVHLFDHRFGTYERQTVAQANQGKLPELGESQHADPSVCSLPKYWVPAREVSSRVAGKGNRGWFLGWRDITGASMLRTAVAAVIPYSAVGNNFPIVLADCPPLPLACLGAALSSFALDFAARSKVGGTHLNFFIFEQLPVPPPAIYSEAGPWCSGQPVGDWLAPRLLELGYTAWDIAAYPADLGYEGAPFRWNDERRTSIRAEIDAAFFHLYGIAREDVTYIMDTFNVLKDREEAARGEYITKRLILECYDAMAKAAETGEAYQTILDPPPADPRVAHPAREAGIVTIPAPAPIPISPTAPDAIPAPIPSVEIPAAPPDILVPAAAAVLPFRRIGEPAEDDKYQTAVPLVSLKAAAGAFGESQEVEPDGWAEIETNHKLRPGMFVAQVVGRSMQPLVPDGAYCLFASPVTGTRQSKVVLVQHHAIHDPENGGSYTIKRYQSEKEPDGTGSWRHREIRLEPINPDFQPIVLTNIPDNEFQVIAELIEVLADNR